MADNITGYITDCRGQRYKLPALLSWEVTHTDGENGTDSFEVSCAYDFRMRDVLENALFFRIVFNGLTAFYGIVDEYEIDASSAGMTVSVSGRGMGGRMLDRKNTGAEYSVCTLGEMLRKYVLPCGILTAVCDDMPAVYGYDVSVNTSCLAALTGFTKLSCGITPRFNREGKLVLTKDKGDRFELDVSGSEECVVRSRRFGVLSEVSVVTADGVQSVVKNEPFIEKGGFSSAVITVPRNTGADRIRYTGKYQIEKSESGAYTLEVTVPELFCAYPCDICTIDSEFCKKGEYRVFETCCFGTERGMGTVIKLVKEEA